MSATCGIDYSQFQEFDDALNLAVDLIRTVTAAVNGRERASYCGQEIDFSQPIKCIDFLDAVAECSQLDPRLFPSTELAQEIKRRGLWNGTQTELDSFRRTWLEWLFETFVLPAIQLPTAIVNFPVELGLSAKVDDTDSTISKRGEIYLQGGFEIAHIYQNEVRPRILRRRYEERLAHRIAAGLPEVELDEDLQKSAAIGMPPMAGLAIGLDRVLMIAAGVDEVGLGNLFSREFTR